MFGVSEMNIFLVVVVTAGYAIVTDLETGKVYATQTATDEGAFGFDIASEHASQEEALTAILTMQAAERART